MRMFTAEAWGEGEYILCIMGAPQGGTLTQREAIFLADWLECHKDNLLQKAAALAKAPYPFCHHPDKCIPKGTCQRDPNCCD